jgi:hypothetical protein
MALYTIAMTFVRARDHWLSTPVVAGFHACTASQIVVTCSRLQTGDPQHLSFECLGVPPALQRLAQGRERFTPWFTPRPIAKVTTG